MTPAHLWRRIRALFRSRRVSRDLQDEMAFHLEMETAKHEARGLPRDEASRLAAGNFGSTIRVREESRDAHGLAWWDGLMSDLRTAARGIRRAPGFHLLLAGTLALGLGLAATILAAVDAILLRPVPYVDPDRTVEVWVREEQGEAHRMTMNGWHAFAGQNGIFEAVAAWDQRGVEYSGPDAATVLTGAAVSRDFFRVLPVPPRLGRTLLDTDYTSGDPVAVVSSRFWRARMGSDTAAIGKTLTLNGKPVTVVGVLPPDFGYPRRAVDVWVPMPRESSDMYVVWVLGRLRGDRTGAARAADAFARAVGREDPSLGLEDGVELRPFAAVRANRGVEQALLLMTAAVLAVLLVSALNAANLLFFRGLGRRREFAMRLALGAGKLRIMRQLLVEVLLVALVASIGALGLARLGIGAMAALLPAEYTWQSMHDIMLSGRVIEGVFVGSIVVAILVGLVPALRAAYSDPAVFRAGGLGSAGATERTGRLRMRLVAAELALATLLMVGGGLFARSFVALNRVDLGIDVDHLAVLDLQLSRSRYPDSAARAAFTRRLDERLRGIPGVTGLSYTDGMAPQTGIHFPDRLEREDGSAPSGLPGEINQAAVDTAYFRLAGTPIILGRRFEPSDLGEQAYNNVIIDQAFARWLWPAASPLGRRFRMDGRWYSVVGVTAHARTGGADDRERRFTIYSPVEASGLGAWRSILVQTRNPAAVLAPVHRAVRALDPLQPIAGVSTAQSRFDEVTQGPRFLSWLMTGFSLVGLLLGGVGLYGVLSYAVGQRTREIGVRMALGASARRIAAWAVLQGGQMVLAGIAFGILLAGLLSRWVKPLLFGVGPHDTLVFIGVPMVLLIVAGFAGLFPSLRAARVEPMRVLRTD
ncbi:MAG: ADOP family duplicated permease [Gemmatimonadales bacterium]